MLWADVVPCDVDATFAIGAWDGPSMPELRGLYATPPLSMLSGLFDAVCNVLSSGDDSSPKYNY